MIAFGFLHFDLFFVCSASMLLRVILAPCLLVYYCKVLTYCPLGARMGSILFFPSLFPTSQGHFVLADGGLFGNPPELEGPNFR